MHDLLGLCRPFGNLQGSVACPYMPVGMKGCGIRVLSAVSVAVRNSLTGDKNVMRAQNFTDPGLKGRVLRHTSTNDYYVPGEYFRECSFSFRVSV